MAAISQTIRNLVAGVSQQPAILRHPEQLEEQVNGFSTEANGLQKRPPSLHIARLLEAPNGIKPMVHYIDRDDNEKYIVVFNGRTCNVYDRAGAQLSTNVESADYIMTDTPRRDLKCVSIADYTFIVNINKVPVMTADLSADYFSTQGVLVNIKGGQYGRTYKVIINGAEKASFETPDGSDPSHSKQIDTNYIANKLATQLTANGYTVETQEGWIHIKNTGITSLETKDGYNNQSMFGIMSSTQKFTNLPATGPENYVVHIIGEKRSKADDYYVRYDKTEGVWKETVKPNILYKFDASTMPHILVRNANGTFSLREAAWGGRTCGDDDSNPIPSFIDENIRDVFFFRNRLGIIAGENVILSSSSDFFQFFMKSAVEILDTDPIDIAVSDNKVSILYQAIPFGEDLLLFSEETQFALRADGVLSPQNAKIDTLTNFNNNKWVKPVGAGRCVYFISERSLYSSVKEYATAFDNTDKKDAQDISSHIPNYLPNGVHKILASTIDNILLFLTEGDPQKIYVYKYLFLNGQKQQSAWSVWDMGANIMGAGFFGSDLYVVTQREGFYYLEKLTFAYNTKDFSQEPYRIYLDRKVLTPAIPESAYNSTDNTTTINIDSYYNDKSVLEEKPFNVVDTDGKVLKVTAGVKQVALVGNYTGKQLIIGEEYSFRIIFSTIMIKTSDESGRTTSTSDGRLQVLNFWVNYQDSGYFKVTVRTPLNNNTYEYQRSMYSLDGANHIDRIVLTSGTFKLPVQAQNTKAVIVLESDTPNPVDLISAGWEGRYVRRTKQV